MKAHGILSVIVLLSSQLLARAGSTWYVNYTAGGSNNGTSWADAFTDLQSAISAASGGDSIFIAKGIYFPSQIAGTSTNPRDKTFLLKNELRLIGGFTGSESHATDRLVDSAHVHGSNRTILNGDIGTLSVTSDNVYHVVTAINLNAGTYLDGITVTNGNANDSSVHVISGVNSERNFGGGIAAYNSPLTLHNCLIDKNLSYSGGAGMYNKSGSDAAISLCWFTYNQVNGNNPNDFGGAGMLNHASNPHITDSKFILNLASNIQGGGGVRNEDGSEAVFLRVRFTKNYATNGDGGAGMYNAQHSDAQLNQVIFERNSTTNQGGGMYCDNSKPVIEDAVFKYNLGVDGGGAMENDAGSDVKLIRCDFIENHANVNGGAVQNWTSSPEMRDVRFIGNLAGEDGGGLYNYNDCSPVIVNAEFWANKAGHNGGGIYNRRACHPAITNLLMYRNEAGIHGGGIYTVSSNGSPCSPIVTNATISNNSADSSGGGAYDDGAGNPKLRNAIVSGNQAPAAEDVDAPSALAATALFKAIIGTDFYSTGSSSPVTVTGNLFVDSTNDDYRLAAASFAIDKGDSSFFNSGKIPDLSLVKTDLPGADRIMAANIDLGAYEVCSDTLNATVIIVAHPGDTVPYGETVTFRAESAGSGPRTLYSWYLNGVLVYTGGSEYKTKAGIDFHHGDSIFVVMHPTTPCYYPDSAQSSTLTMSVMTGITTFHRSVIPFSVYPNPNNGRFTVSGPFGKDAGYEIILTDLYGREFLRTAIRPGEYEIIPDDGLMNGLYLLHICRNDGIIATMRMVVNH